MKNEKLNFLDCIFHWLEKYFILKFQISKIFEDNFGGYPIPLPSPIQSWFVIIDFLFNILSEI